MALHLILLAAFLAAPTDPPPQGDMVEMFRQVCMQGGARFRQGTVSPVQQSELPVLFSQYLTRTPVRGLGARTGISFYRITLAGADGFIAVEQRRGPPEGAQICSLAGRPMQFMPTLERLHPGVSASLPGFLGRDATSWQTASPLGYYLRVEALQDGYVALQTSSMDVKELRRLRHRLPKPREAKAGKGAN